MPIGKSWKIAAGFAIPAALAGCSAFSSPEIKDCEQELLRELRAPSTYNRIEADTTVMDHLKPAEFWVSIKYDAANAFGTPIRGEKICRYALVDGRADLNQTIDTGAPLTEISTLAESPASSPRALTGRPRHLPDPHPRRRLHQIANLDLAAMQIRRTMRPLPRPNFAGRGIAHANHLKVAPINFSAMRSGGGMPIPRCCRLGNRCGKPGGRSASINFEASPAM